MTNRIALVSGANRGIGLEVARQLAERNHTVLLGSRDLRMGTTAAAGLREVGLDAVPLQLDIADIASVRAVTANIDQRYGPLDVLVNNAAIDYDSDQAASTADLNRVRHDLDTNLFGT